MVELDRLVKSRLWLRIVIGMVLGLATGVALGPSAGWVDPAAAALIGEWLALPGNLFLAAIQMIVLPLVVASVIRGIAASGDPEQLKRSGIGLAGYFVFTTLAATSIGVALGYLIAPGQYVSADVRMSLMQGGAPAVAPLETGGLAAVPSGIVNLLPTNPLTAMVEGQMLQVVLFAIVLGVALISIEPESSKPLLDLMGSVQKVSMRVVAFVMQLAPYAVFGLLAQTMIGTGVELLVGLGVYVASVVGGLCTLLLVYLAIAAVAGRRPFAFLAAIREPQLLAFSTDSSAATMPATIRAAEDRLGLRPSIAQLVIPLGVTMNMGGTALYHGIATVFLAQVFDMQLAPSSLAALLMTSLAASIGAPGTPGIGIVVLATVLTSAGVPLAGLTMIIGFDQVLGRVRTVMNVSGDLVAAVVMDRLVGGPASQEEETAREAELDLIRAKTRTDVVVTGDGS